MHRSRLSTRRAYTLVEVMIATVLLAIVGVVTFGFLRSGTELFAKSTALNQSHLSIRRLLDRLSDTLQTAENVPSLLNTAGATVTGSAAAGVHFDRFIAEPYVFQPAAGTVAASATSLTVEYPITDPGNPSNPLANLARVPAPSVGDFFVYLTPTGSVRARITAVGSTSTISTTPPHARVTLTFAAAVGKGVSWVSGQTIQGRLVRHEAFLVMPTTGGGNELRYYPKFEPLPALNSPANYSVISDQLMSEAGDATPFKLVRINDEPMIEVNLRTRTRDGYDWLAKRQVGGFNSYAAVTMRLSSRLNARTQQ